MLRALLILMLATVAFSAENLNNQIANFQKECPSICSDNNFTKDNDISVLENNDYKIQNNKSEKYYFHNLSVRSIGDSTGKNIGIRNIEEGVPSKPTFLRAFVEFLKYFNRKEEDISVNISIILRWNQPEFTNGRIQEYTIQYWYIENLTKIQIPDVNIPATREQYKIYDLKPDTTYYFQVRARTKVAPSPYTDLINISTTHEIPIPRLLITSESGLIDSDVDIQTNVQMPYDEYDIIEIVYSMLEHRFFWINKMRELITSSMDKITNYKKMAKLDITAHNLCIDWVTRNLYWIQNNNQGTSSIMKLDLELYRISGYTYNNINGYFLDYTYNNILNIKTAKFLNVLPSMGYLYWMESISSDEHVIMQSDLDGENVQSFLREQNDTCFCPYKLLNSSSMQIDDTNIEKPLMYWTWKDSLIMADIHNCKCSLILSAESDEILFEYLTIDKINIYLYSNRERLIYILKKRYAFFENKENAFKHVQKMNLTYTSIHKIIPISGSLQPYPLAKCLTPNISDKYLNNNVITEQDENSVLINFPKIEPKYECKKYNLPTTLHSVNVKDCLNNYISKKWIAPDERFLMIFSSTPFTNYTLYWMSINMYSLMLSTQLPSAKIILRTNSGKLNAPVNVTAQVLTPNLVVVLWLPPKNINCTNVIYEVHWMFTERGTYLSEKRQLIKPERTANDKFFTKIHLSFLNKLYLIYVRVYPAINSNFYTDSLNETFYMKWNNLTLTAVSANSMVISWIYNFNMTVPYILEYKNVIMEKWQTLDSNIKISTNKIIYHIENLSPRTQYTFRLILEYPEYEENCVWPSDERFTFQTLDLTKSVEILPAQYYLPLLGFIAFICCIYYFYYLYRQCKKGKIQILYPVIPDIELVALSEVPHSNFYFNELYTSMLQYNPDEIPLTIIRNKQITLTKFLGSGAFGEVFQGIVKNLEESNTTSVAIKRLRRNASKQEKEKFLDEAKLMSNFCHRHVLRLLGICVDGNSTLLILELMETDLLKYLKENREILQSSDPHVLRLRDLLAMCEDVARGCHYLEKMRFVHRDLACRNCLISTRNRKNRIVKIGDFGLAKDIYSDEYYRMKGAGPLPVRWMAPESLIDGMFSSKSDVWAFGVLMWEITSLGERPYLTRTNSEVLQYIRGEGRLSKPLNCPSTLYQLMMRCWNAADDRPNFKVCLENIVALKYNIEDAALKPIDVTWPTMNILESPPVTMEFESSDFSSNSQSGVKTYQL